MMCTRSNGRQDLNQKTNVPGIDTAGNEHLEPQNVAKIPDNVTKPGILDTEELIHIHHIGILVWMQS